ncbi:hypothetical protein Dimus_030285 [Dionaea muscipula]
MGKAKAKASSTCPKIILGSSARPSDFGIHCPMETLEEDPEAEEATVTSQCDASSSSDSSMEDEQHDAPDLEQVRSVPLPSFSVLPSGLILANQELQKPIEMDSETLTLCDELVQNRAPSNGSPVVVADLPNPSISQQEAQPDSTDRGTSKGQWSHLFANNCKPLADFMLEKTTQANAYIPVELEQNAQEPVASSDLHCSRVQELTVTSPFIEPNPGTGQTIISQQAPSSSTQTITDPEGFQQVLSKLHKRNLRS